MEIYRLAPADHGEDFTWLIIDHRAEGYSGKRNFVTVKNWLYKMEQNFSLVQLTIAKQIYDHTNITFASPVFTGSTSI